MAATNFKFAAAFQERMTHKTTQSAAAKVGEDLVKSYRAFKKVNYHLHLGVSGKLVVLQSRKPLLCSSDIEIPADILLYVHLSTVVGQTEVFQTDLSYHYPTTTEAQGGALFPLVE